MYVDVQAGEAVRSGLLVPAAAVQMVGARPVVYVASQEHPGRFVERTVQVGAASGDRVPVLAGLEAGERVVTDGVFFLRAETERLRGSRP
jgi:multidrug efflux pump subunit AcrA (membrane-fusion protein)